VPSQSCQRIIDPNLPEALRFTRVGQHLIVFAEAADAIVIVDFLHARSDLPTRLLRAHWTKLTLRVLVPWG
jgi:hypothetical protein